MTNNNFYPEPNPYNRPALPPARPRVASYDEREGNLALAVSNAVTLEGFRVETQGPGQVILVKGRPTSHGLHLGITLLLAFLSLLAAGIPIWFIWVVVWIVVAAKNRRRTLILRVDQYANVTRNYA